jgi:hypothetical protein
MSSRNMITMKRMTMIATRRSPMVTLMSECVRQDGRISSRWRAGKAASP